MPQGDLGTGVVTVGQVQNIMVRSWLGYQPAGTPLASVQLWPPSRRPPAPSSLSPPCALVSTQGLIFTLAIFLGMFNCMTVQPVMGAERTVFYRERSSSYYSPLPYAMATGAVEVPYLLVQSFLMVIITYWQALLHLPFALPPQRASAAND